MKAIKTPHYVHHSAAIIFIALLISSSADVFARPNLALYRPVWASSVGEDNPPGKAVNGVTSDRWESNTTDSEWIMVDLGVPYAVDSVFVNWETAAGQDYAIQTATTLPTSDAGWTTAAHITDGTQGEKRSITFAPVQARFVRLSGYKRASIFGYSIWEFEVYGNYSGCVPPVVAADPADRTFNAGLNTSFNVYANGTDMLFQWQRSSPSGLAWADITNATSAYYAFKPVAADSGALFRCVVSSPCGGDTSNAASLSWSQKARINLACKKFAKCTSAEGGDLVASNVVDDDSSTRWGTDYKNDPNKDSAWVYVDLGSVCFIDSVFLNWEDSGAKEYLLQVANAASDNDQGWTTVSHITDGKGWEKRPIKIAQTQARFVRVRCLQRLSGFGYSMFEFEVYGPSSTAALPAPKTGMVHDQSFISVLPGRNFCVIATKRSAPAEYSASVFSLEGQLVRTFAGSSKTFVWDYSGQNGCRVTNGIYLITVTSRGQAVKAKIAVCR
ncbi:MAG TPA: discoidin domain-containing protein [Chitinivibrionales bacterium]|nr:discoidin domain-containing protein [Chitinivibrionales bacterium]